jgi:hypothetical protein
MVEIDVWVQENKIFLGHDNPQYETTLEFLKHPNMYCHAKNLQALQLLTVERIRCFSHNTDPYTLTSDGLIWAYPGQPLSKNSIAVMPELAGQDYDWSEAAGVCSDFVKNLKANFTKRRVALFLVGEPRTYTVTKDSILKNIVYCNGADIFMCLSCPLQDITRIRQELIDIYHPKSIVFVEEHPELIQEEQQLIQNAFQRHGQMENAIQVRQWCKILESWRKMQKYEQENGIQYTHIIKARLDLVVDRPLVLNNYDTNNVIHGMYLIQRIFLSYFTRKRLGRYNQFW